MEEMSLPDDQVDREPGRGRIVLVVLDGLGENARLRADTSDDPHLALRLREAAIKHERMARRLRRTDALDPA